MKLSEANLAVTLARFGLQDAKDAVAKAKAKEIDAQLLLDNALQIRKELRDAS